MKNKQIICEENFFHDLFMDYYPSLLSFACYYVEEEVVAEDLVQDVFVKDVGATGEMEGRGKFFGLCLSDGAFSVFQLFTWGEVEGRDDAFV